MSKIDIIDSILHEDFKVKSDFLEEINVDKKGKPFTMKRQVLSKNEINYSIYHYEQSQKFLPFFNDDISGLKKMCDFILFVEETHHLHILLIEMKLGTESAKKQLDAGKCFATYIINTIERLGLGLDITDDNLHIKQVRISERISKKQKLNKEIETNEFGVMEHNHPHIFLLKEYLAY